MKTKKFLLFTTLLGTLCIFQSCARNGNDVWEDTKSAGRHMRRGVCTLGGKHGDSRQVRCRDEFEYIDAGYGYGYESPSNVGFEDCQDNNYSASEFVPLQDADNDELAMADMVAQQPRETPGEIGSRIPGIEAFRDPNTIPGMAGIFQNIYFEYDSSLVKGPNNLQIIHNIAGYLRSHPNIYLFLEGHTDERGPQAYNLALGSRRSNSVRNALISEGVNPDRLFTVSYGKERPVVLERHEEGWAKNRRVEFKVYAR